mgnify:CR=1 FL=1
MSTSSCADLRSQCSTPLAWMLSRTPDWPRCSSNKTAARRLPRHKAVAHSHMQINHRNLTSTLVFDLDHTNAMIWDDAGLPAPNLIVRDPVSGRAHLYYAIEAVSTGPRSRSKPIRYMRAVYDAFAERLRADRNYHSGPVAKTPGHSRWHTEQLHSHAYCLGELAEHVELASGPPWRRPSTEEDDMGDSRNCYLFKHLRQYAYAIVVDARKRGDFEAFAEHLRDYAEGHNSFRDKGYDSDLPASEIRSLVKSVSRWTWDHYFAGGQGPRVMDLDPDMPLPERQRLAAARTHAARKEKTARRIRAACANLLARGETLSRAAVARETGLRWHTVDAHKYLLDAAEHGVDTAADPPPDPGESGEEAASEAAAIENPGDQRDRGTEPEKPAINGCGRCCAVYQVETGLASILCRCSRPRRTPPNTPPAGKIGSSAPDPLPPDKKTRAQRPGHKGYRTG